MPKLLQINSTSNWGSTGKIAEQIGLKAKEAGWESWIAYGRSANPSQLNIIKVGNMFSVYEHFAENRLLDREGLASLIETKKLIRKIEVIKPNVVQLHNIHDHWLNYKILFEYLNKTDIKVVWTFHDCWAFTGHCYHFVEYNCFQWQIECKKCPSNNCLIKRTNRNFNLKKSLFTRNKNLIIVPCSDWMGDFVKQSFLKDKQIKVIHNGVDLNTFKPFPSAKTNDGKFRIIAISNVWLPYKGIYDIFKLREMLSDEYDITIVGLSYKQMKNTPANIRGIQRTQNVHELVRLYNEADVLINPTYADTFPTINLEALACGTPVITYRTGGSPEAVDDKTGVVVPQGDIEALADAIREMRVNRLSSIDCRKRAVQHFDKNKCFEEYVKLYGEQINRQ